MNMLTPSKITYFKRTKDIAQSYSVVVTLVISSYVMYLIRKGPASDCNPSMFTLSRQLYKIFNMSLPLKLFPYE